MQKPAIDVNKVDSWTCDNPSVTSTCSFDLSLELARIDADRF